MTNKIDPCDTMRTNLIAAAIGLQQCTKTAANIVPIPGGDRVIAIGTPAEVRALLPKRELPPELKAAIEEAAKTRAPGWYTRPAIFMPRAASRILLEIASVRVERLQDISEPDAAAEGWPRRPEVSDDPQVHADAARDWYMDLWEQINGAGSWAANPWVWVVEFRRIEG